MHHTAGIVKRAMLKTDTLWWDDYMLKQIFSWAGHVGRMQAYDPSRLVLQSFLHKSRRFLIFLQQSYGQQCHGQRFHVWRWEKSFYQFFGDSWLQHTLQSDEWNDKFTAWLIWRKRTLNYKSHKDNKFSFLNVFNDLVIEDYVSEAQSCTDSSDTTDSSGDSL